MARARTIKPRFFTNETLCSLPPLARLLFAGLWTIADRDGRLEDRPQRIKAEVLPYDRCDVNKLLQSLHDQKFISRYVVQEQGFIQITAWYKHQSPHVKEGASTIPAPDLSDARSGNSGASPSLYLNPITLTLNPTHEEPGNAPNKRQTFPLDVWADRLYDQHVKRKGRPLVEGACLKILRRCEREGKDPVAEFERIEARLQAWCETHEWRKSNGQYAPQLAEWLDDKGFEVAPSPDPPSTNNGGNPPSKTTMLERIARGEITSEEAFGHGSH